MIFRLAFSLARPVPEIATASRPDLSKPALILSRQWPWLRPRLRQWPWLRPRLRQWPSLRPRLLALLAQRRGYPLEAQVCESQIAFDGADVKKRVGNFPG